MDFNTWITSTKIACRGLYDANAPENSLAAINNAVQKGYGLCLDCRALADNTIVVFKDERLSRMTGNNGFISHCTLQDIENLTLAKTNEHIPTLDQALAIIAGKVPVIIDIKNMDKVNWEKHVWKILKGYKGEYAVASANPYSLEWFKNNAPKVKRGQISCSYKDSSLPFFKRRAYRKMKYNKDVSEPNFIMYRCEDLPNRYIKKYKHLPLLAWHVKTNEQAEKMRKIANNIVLEGLEI